MSGPVLFLRAHVAGYTRQDGTAVAPYEAPRRHAAQSPPVVTYSSGASAPAQMRGYILAGSPFGVSLLEVTPGSASWDMMIEASRRGIPVFVDSGAFTIHTGGGEMDWPGYEAKVRRLIAEARGAPLHIVMPDVVGDQDASLAQLDRMAPLVRDVIAAGHDALVPVQRGRRSPYMAWRAAVHILGTDDFTASVPSNKAAFNTADLADLMSGPLHPRRVHFLGVAGDRARLAELVAVVHRAWPTTEVSSDANRLRAKVGQGRFLTEEKKRQDARLFAQFRWLIEQDHPELVEAWDRSGRAALGATGTTAAIHADEVRSRAQRDLFWGG